MSPNESEPHLMSLDKFRTGEKPSRCWIGEGRREEAGQQSEPAQRSGGVGVEGTSGSSAKVSWEISGGGRKAQPHAQADGTSEAGGVVGEVGILRSSQEAPVMGVERRRHTCSEVRSDRWPKAPQGDTPPRGPSSSTLMEGASGNASTRPNSESRIWENRPFGSMRGGRESVIGLAPFNPTSPAYSTKSNLPWPKMDQPEAKETGGIQTGQTQSNQKERFDPGLSTKKSNPKQSAGGLTRKLGLFWTSDSVGGKPASA